MGLFVCLHNQLGAISRLRYLSESASHLLSFLVSEYVFNVGRVGFKKKSLNDPDCNILPKYSPPLLPSSPRFSPHPPTPKENSLKIGGRKARKGLLRPPKLQAGKGDSCAPSHQIHFDAWRLLQVRVKTLLEADQQPFFPWQEFRRKTHVPLRAGALRNKPLARLTGEQIGLGLGCKCN